MNTSDQQLRYVSPSDIGPNPENPRLIFRQEEMESLLISIDRHGIQVPLTVFKDGLKYKLIDGERRWRCAVKLNLKRVPVLVQKKPSELENLVLMYNIHALREQWDYYTIASKLERIIALYSVDHQGIVPTELVLSELTGLTRGSIRRCQLLLNLPDRFKNLLVAELKKPKSQQRLSEDFFLEMEKSLKTVTNRVPEYAPRLDAIRDVLVDKFSRNIISAVTDFRQLSKIATAIEGLGIAQSSAKRALNAVFDGGKDLGIREAYEQTVKFEYVERRVSLSAIDLTEFIDSVLEDGRRADLDDALIISFKELYERLRKLFKA